MKNKKNFDVIFSSNHLAGKKYDISKLLINQEIGNRSQEKNILLSVNDFRYKFLKSELRNDKLNTTFGFNITSSIKFVLDSLPQNIIITTLEFPPVIKILKSSSKNVIAILNLDNNNINLIKTLKDNNEKEVIFLLDHISYIDGKNLLSKLLDNKALLDYLSNFKIHIIIDGAHAIGNISTLRDISNIKKGIENKLTLVSFTYIFDCYKWLQGLWGMSIIISTSNKIIETHDFIFPNAKFTQDNFGFKFFKPYSASFNPTLTYWYLNTKIIKRRISILDNVIPKNQKLTNLFISKYSKYQFKNMTILNDDTKYSSNIVSIKTAKPRNLHNYLLGQGIITHIIARRKFKPDSSYQTYPEVLRLCFSSTLIKSNDINFLINLLKKYDKFYF